MPADLHDQFGRRTGQKLICAERSATDVGCNPGVLWLYTYDVLAALFMRCFYRGVDFRQLFHPFYIAVKLCVGCLWNVAAEPVH